MGVKSSLGIDENIAAALSYVFGIVSGIVFLLLEKDSRFVKFHALQSIVASAVFIVLNMVLGYIPWIGWLLLALLAPVAFIVWLVLIFQAWKHRRWKLPFIGDFVEKQLMSMR